MPALWWVTLWATLVLGAVAFLGWVVWGLWRRLRALWREVGAQGRRAGELGRLVEDIRVPDNLFS